MFLTQRFGKLVASAGALALAGAGIFGAAAANAEAINPNATGSLTIHKSSAEAGDEGNGQLQNPDPGAGEELDGITFELQPVLHDGMAIDLSTSDGWKAAETVMEQTAPALPAGYTLGAADDQDTANGGVAEFSGLDLGLYLVTETGAGDNLVDSVVAPFWVTIPNPDETSEWNYNVHVYPKNKLNDFAPSKTVDEVAKKLGDTITWTISTPVPHSDLPRTSFSIKDALPAGLDFANWGDIKIGGQTLTAGDDYTISADNTEVVFTPAGRAKLDAATTNGSATVTAVLVSTIASVEPANGEIVNTATVTLNGKTKDATANTNWGVLSLRKISDDGNETALNGATFEVYAEGPDADGNPTGTPLYTGTTENGETISWTLNVGIGTDVDQTYYVRETVAPTGYVLPADPWAEYVVRAGNTAAVVHDIENHKAEGPDLPLTGAQGTLLFSIAGVGLMGAAGGAVLVRRARRRSQA